MDGGRHALTGFVYQATVILDVLLPQFERHPSTRARPEGADDLEFEWQENGMTCRQFVQIKKTKEDDSGQPKFEPWTLGAVVRELLPDALRKLLGNAFTQRWILGDDVQNDVRELIQAGNDAQEKAMRAYVDTLDLLAREQSGVTKELPEKEKRALGKWHFRVDSNSTAERNIDQMVDALARRLSSAGAVQQKIDVFKNAVRAIHQELPDVLSRIQLQSTFGHEDAIRRRVYEKLARRYPISLTRIEHTIYRNCSGVVQDIATKKGTWISATDLDELIQKVWPEMMVLRVPPPLPQRHVAQQDIIDAVLRRLPCRAVEVVGVSGSGKTTLARAFYDHVCNSMSDTRVMYAEVRRGRSLREVLTSVTFELSKLGFPEPWQAATSSTALTEEERAQEIAKALDMVPGKTIVLIDLVEGDCDEEFKRLLAALLNGKPPEQFALVIFGQEPALTALTSVEKNGLGISAPIDQRGFTFDEFVDLCSHFHPDIERERLWDVYHRIAAGRIAGLLAYLGNLLARSESIAAMEQIAAAPPEQRLRRAIRERFNRIPETHRVAAERLACMLLPFRVPEAIDTFPEDRIKAATDSLLELGLLSHHDSERLETHETVRLCLEEEMPPALRKEAHAALAMWCRRQGDLAAEIYHLDKAGETSTAHQKAREAFLSDERGGGLSDYVVRNKLITGAELADVLLAEKLPERVYIIPRLLRKLGDESVARKLFNELVLQIDRFDQDYRWTWWMTEAILSSFQARLHELVMFALAAPRDENHSKIRKRLEYVAHGARRAGGRVDHRLLALFDRQDDLIKWSMLDILLIDPRRDVLGKVLAFIAANDRPQDGGRGSYVARRGPSIGLQLRTREEILAFLGAIPLPDTNEILISQSPAFGKLSELVWSLRSTLQPVCIEVLGAGVEDEIVLENALRMLLLLRDMRCLSLAKPHRNRQSRFGNLCALIPTMFGEVVDKTEYYDRLLNPGADINDRVGDFMILATMEGDSWLVYERLVQVDPVSARPFRFLALTQQTMLPPSKKSIPVLEEFLKECTDDSKAMLWAPLLAKLGELPSEMADDMLIGVLSHAQPRVRLIAVTALQHRRCRRALMPLVNMVAPEPHPQVAQTGLVAAAASGPTSMAELGPLWDGSEHRSLWRCIVAGRLRAESEAAFLVETAINPESNWQLRRAAILSASRLPFDVALAKIVEPVMRERSPFTLDKNHAFLGHHALSALLQQHSDPEFQATAARNGFERVLRIWFDVFVEDALFTNGTPSGADAARWVCDKLREKPNATGEDLQRLIDGIHVPILHAAVLRGLRMAAQPERIAEFIRTADSEWLLLRAMCEYDKCFNADITAKLDELLAASRFPESPYGKNVVTSSQRRTAAADRLVHPSTPAPKIVSMTVVDVMGALTSRALPTKERFIVTCADKNELQNLAELLDPANDYTLELRPAEPRVSFVGGGVSVGGVVRDRRDNGAQIRKTLRPAIAAANRFQIDIPWHTKLLADREYFKAFLEHLGAAGNADWLYEELAQYSDIMFPQLDDSILLNPILKLIDARMIPYLRQFADMGTDGLMESLCSIARRIDDPAIDSVLIALFRRWRARFDHKIKRSQHDENHALWRALGCLRTHSRFQLIPGYADRLIELLHHPMRPWNKDDIIRILMESPRSYARLECLLFRSAPFEHYHEDEVERLDAAADRLFREVR